MFAQLQDKVSPFQLAKRTRNGSYQISLVQQQQPLQGSHARSYLQLLSKTYTKLSFTAI